MKDYDAKVSNKKGELFADDATIKKISNNTMDIYCKAENMEDGRARVVVFFDLGGAYLSSSRHPEEFKIAEDIIYAFAIETAQKAVEEQIKEAEKLLKKLGSDQERLVKENEDLNQNIERYKENIIKAEEGVEQNLKDQESKKIEIAGQEEALNMVKEKLQKIE